MIKIDKTSYVQQMNIEKRILSIHPYTITPPKTDSGRWQTYIKRDGENRKIIRASSYDKLMEQLFDFYFSSISYSDLPLQRVYEEWITYKETITESPNTIRRHEQHWKKYFEKEWGIKKLKHFDKLELQRMCNQLVKEKNLTSKEWQNLKTILSGVFSYSTDKGYISSDPMISVKITVKFRQVNKKTGATETFQTDEYNRLLQYLEVKFIETQDSVYLSLKLDLYLGLRVGELSSLKWKDWIGLKNLHISREEIKKSLRTPDGWVDEYEVVDHTKTHTDRVIPLVPSAVSILNRIKMSQPDINPDGYIFTRDGNRITSRQITYALEKACRSLGIDTKRTHKIRKTVASRLNAGAVPLDAIREFLGHSSSQTTLGYIFNPLTEKETYEKMAKAL